MAPAVSPIVRSSPPTRTLRDSLEAAAWRSVGEGWQPLHGRFVDLGVSFEWHDFRCRQDLAWDSSFHPESIEICLNLEGSGRLDCRRSQTRLNGACSAFYCQGNDPLSARRDKNESHRFVTVEFAPSFLEGHLLENADQLHPYLREYLSGSRTSFVSRPRPLTARLAEWVNHLRLPPVHRSAQPLWFQSKALEIMAECFYTTPDQEEFFCVRQKQLSHQRVREVIALLQKDLSEPPSLEKLGKEVGCSPFYLSRVFSKEKKVTIPQYLRRLRMERAAELLASGKYNVTEAAMEVGYSSISHFSQAFCQTIGCCPGMYPRGLNGKSGDPKGAQRRPPAGK